MIKYYILLLVVIVNVSCAEISQRTSGLKSQPAAIKYKYTNKLVNESSPYLLQHAHNPVNWYPWGDEALQKASKENKLLLISVGYSACHWCHVMEHESFEDTAVANYMNKHFVAIKVDREERPDVDDVYMSACHLSSGGNCGWPLNAFALADGRPFFAGTYFPKDNWFKVMKSIVELSQKDPAKMEEYAERITEGVINQEIVSLNEANVVYKAENLDALFSTYNNAIDYEEGGRKGRMKFPMPNNWMYLLQYYQTSKNEKALTAVTTTLTKMAEGGIYDQLGGGFARYATDEIWKVPHFEKMLYDNGQLVSLYSEAYRITKNPLYKKVVYETLEFIERDLKSKEGAFFASLDADSEGEEGKYYVWTKEEIEEILKDEQTINVFSDYYNIVPHGNWEDEKNILFRTQKIERIAKDYGIAVEDVMHIVKIGKTALMKVRAKRVSPELDDKVLTSWNALMLKGYIDAYRTFDDEAFLKTALENAKFLMKNMAASDYRLKRNYKDGKAVINAFLDDYALMTDACIALYQATFDEKWLNIAKSFTDYTLTNFYDKESGMFFYTSNLDAALIARKMEVSDNVIPASNSIMAKNLLTLGTYFYNKNYLEKAKTMMNNMETTVMTSQQPYFYSNWCSLYHLSVFPPYEVAIIGDDFASVRKEMDQYALPNHLLLGGKNEGSLELLKDKLVPGETRIYVCQDKICKSPVLKVKEAVEQMK